MVPICFSLKRTLSTAFAVVFMAGAVLSDQAHGIAMYGDPKLPPDFESLPYAYANAPKGGRIVTGNTGGFDSLNPFIRKGTVPWQLRFFTYDSLMGRNRDEPFALYGLIAESIKTPPNRAWVEFKIRKEARFSDGNPITVEDVIWSYETLGTSGHPRYLGFWKKVDTIEATGPRSVRITFNTEDRELALIAGMRPILQKAQWVGKDIAEATLEDIPIGSGAYVISDFEAGRYVTLSRDPNYWAADLPFRKGTNNFDEIQIDFYGDGDVLFEAFKAGEISYVREFNAESWASQYNFPSAQAGDIVKSEIPHQKPSGMTGFVINARRAPFNDIRVRDALIHAFNFEFINDTMTGGRQARISSYFSGSVLSMESGVANGKVAELLSPFKNEIPADAISGYELPKSNGSLRNRKNFQIAAKLLDEAGFVVVDGKRHDANGNPLTLEILLRQGDSQSKAIIDIYKKSVERLGISVTVSLTDNAQFTQRVNDFDFDMVNYRRSLSLSPGNEQNLYWGSESADQTGSRNLMGVKSAAIDSLINTMLTSNSQDDFIAATRALDRVLTSGRHVIPIWNYAVGRIAHRKEMQFPDTLSIYGDGADWMPALWWWDK